MPIAGQELLRRITAVVESARAAEEAVRSAAQKAHSELDLLVTDQSEALRELAQHYLPRLDDDVERDGWSEMHAALREIRLRQDDARRQHSERMKAAEQRCSETEERASRLKTDVDELAAQCDALAHRLAGQLAEDADFQHMSKLAASSQARLEQAEANLADVEQDAKTKLPNYQQSRLFQYLHRRSCGTENDSSRGLTRRLDRWVARLIDYPRAARGFRFLSMAPRQMRQLIEDQKQLVKTAVAEVERRQTEAADVIGLSQLLRGGAKARSEQGQATAAAEAARLERDQVQLKLAELDSPESGFYREAITAFQDLLQRTERSLVAARAAQTPELTDDQVVARLKHLDAQVNNRKREYDQRFAAAESAAQRTARLQELSSRCQRARFDLPRRVFDDQLDLERLLNSVLDGTASVESVYQELSRNQRVEPSPGEAAVEAILSPAGQVLLQAMAQAAGAALGSYAARAGEQNRKDSRQRGWF